MPVLEQLEKDIEATCGRMAVREGCIFLKIQASKGFPDRVVLGPKGQTLIIEFKKPGGIVSPLQEHTICKLRKMGHLVEVVDSVRYFRILLDLLLKHGSLTNTKLAELIGSSSLPQDSSSLPDLAKPQSPWQLYRDLGS